MSDDTMSDRTIGWAFVGVQIVLLGALILLPGGNDWATPRWLHQVGTVVNVAGLALVVVAGLGLGSALTPTPVPRQAGKLSTGGLYRIARHPIYSGVLLIVLALAVPSGSWVHAVIGAITFGFFVVKARWEERRLAVQYPDYAAYASKTARFFPYIY
jgi:protein-S-isoprenylcysteine O-methyltransferase Ste14